MLAQGRESFTSVNPGAGLPAAQLPSCLTALFWGSAISNSKGLGMTFCTPVGKENLKFETQKMQSPMGDMPLTLSPRVCVFAVRLFLFVCLFFYTYISYKRGNVRNKPFN